MEINANKFSFLQNGVYDNIFPHIVGILLYKVENIAGGMKYLVYMLNIDN